ncbi:hypothetical protein M0208_12560 [Sphingomonas sp. SUN019]|uniref:cyanobactin maturation protease PatG family protein n=1 Tax=Sphingomonas sp. SUN019 TaxID=2937788 RepID=UPI0021648A48|nr:hypothetical protein [Sphingomonas sp. SUN019]UVO51300.1 hypothetical protein M0208_12560 [Sphingomonas sp. SUN019]
MNEQLDAGTPLDELSLVGSQTMPPPGMSQASGTVTPQAGCAACGDPDAAAEQSATRSSAPHVYAIGRIEARFPNLAVEKEFAQAAGRAETAGRSDHQVLHETLSRRENRYLLRQLCWVLDIQGLESYLVLPRDPVDLEVLMDAVRPAKSANDIDVVIGVRGPIAPVSICNGLMVPVLVFDQIYSFDRTALIAAIPKPDRMNEKQFGPAADELFTRIMQMTDNMGATDEHRALNYLAMRYPVIYHRAAEQFANDYSLSSVGTRPVAASQMRHMVDVIFSYANRKTDFREQFYVRVDVTEEFPFLVTKMAPFYEYGGRS